MSKTLIVGAGPIAVEYAQILRKLNREVKVVGRGKESADKFEQQTGIPVQTGGLESLKQEDLRDLSECIIAVGEKWLGQVCLSALSLGLKKILVEKPGGFTAEEIREVAEKSKELNAQVHIAYNRRFFGSVRQAKKLIADDGGPRSLHFEFTEWSTVIADIPKEEGVKEEWFLANSSHVVDTAFYLAGWPKSMTSQTKGELSWYSKASVFTGSGETESGALFSYFADWGSAGRWGIEVMTENFRFVFRPMEELQIIKRNTVKLEKVEPIDEYDEQHKHGFYLQTKAFLEEDYRELLSIEEQAKHMSVYEVIEKSGSL